MKWLRKGHELDRFAESLIQMKNLYIFGIGGNAQEMLLMISGIAEPLPCELVLIDSNEEKQRLGYQGRTIHPAEYLYDRLTSDARVVVAPCGHAGAEIRKACLSHGVKPEQIFDGESFLYRVLPVYLSYLNKKVIFHSVSMLPSTVCNLNCRDCLNFAPYVRQPVTYTLAECRKNVDLFFRAVGLVFRFQITGGEPFLYHDLCPLLDYIGMHYGKQILRFEVVTNGTIMPSNAILDALKRNHITVFLDDYTMSLPSYQADLRDAIISRLRSEGVNFVDNHVEKWFRLYTPDQLPPDRTPKEMETMFQKCGVPWTTLENGRLTACNYGLYAAKAGVLEDCAAEYFDLRDYTPDRAKELLEFRCGYNERGYVNLCRVCNGWGGNTCYCQPALQQSRVQYADEK